MSREGDNLPLTAEAYEHLKPKADGILITKDRYVIPEKDGLFIELDVFHGKYEGVFWPKLNFPQRTQPTPTLHRNGSGKM